MLRNIERRLNSATAFGVQDWDERTGFARWWRTALRRAILPRVVRSITSGMTQFAKFIGLQDRWAQRRLCLCYPG